MRWIQAIFAVCLVLFCLVRFGPAAPAEDCSSGPEIRVTVRPLFPNPVYDFSSGIPEIQVVANDIVHRVREGWALGFTSYQPVLSMDAPVAVTALPGGKFCARPRYVNIEVGVRDETVYVPREIPGESCGFSEVIAHEQRHLAVNRETIRKYAALLEKKFADYLKADENAPSADAINAAILRQNGLRAVLDDAAAQMITENSAEQGDVDSADEYDRLLHICNGELADIVRQAREERVFAERF